MRLVAGMSFCSIQLEIACRIPNAGSFIRPSPNIFYGTSFLNALYSKYVELLHGSESQEMVLLGSSNGAIEVEAVDLDKIRGKFANLDRLREVSLDSESVARYDEPPGSIRSTCPSRSPSDPENFHFSPNLHRRSRPGFDHKPHTQLGSDRSHLC